MMNDATKAHLKSSPSYTVEDGDAAIKADLAFLDTHPEVCIINRTPTAWERENFGLPPGTMTSIARTIEGYDLRTFIVPRS